MEHAWIERRLKELGRRKGALAAALGLPPSRVSELCKGERRLQLDEVLPLAEFLRLSPADVLRRTFVDWRGALVSEPSEFKQETGVPKALKERVRALEPDGGGAGAAARHGKPGVASTVKKSPQSPTTIAMGEAEFVSELDVRASAGDGSIVDYENEAHQWAFPAPWLRAELNAKPSDLRIITIEGDSMVSEPPGRYDLMPGDKVIINVADLRPSPPGAFIVYDGLGLVAKRVEYIVDSDPPSIRIMSNNRLYRDYIRSLEEAIIMGRVVGRFQRF